MTDLEMPEPTIDNLRKTSLDALIGEVIHLRRFVGLLLLNLKDMRNAQGFSQEQEHRILAVESRLDMLEAHSRYSKEKLLPELENRINQKIERLNWHFDDERRFDDDDDDDERTRK